MVAPLSPPPVSSPAHSGDGAADLASTLARITTRALAGERADAADLAAVLAASDVDTLDVVAAAGRVRRRHFGNRVKLNYLVNVKSGLCPEDCSYCSQAKGSQADILTYRMVEPEAVVEAASRAASVGAARVCLVASGRGPTDREVDSVAAATEAVHAAHPDVEICACLGLLAAGQADRLAAAGVHAYNHNLNTSGEHYAEICSTHTFDDRVATVNAAAEAGLSACSGALFGMGETDDDILAVIEGLAAVDPDSIPVNFLIPIDGTPLAGRWELTPWRCLRILSALRFAFPDKEVRIAGGREQHLRSLQGLGLMVANSIFVGDYLTTEGQEAHADLEMLADHGLVPLGAEDDWVPPRPSTPEVTIRRRGVGAAP